MRCWLAIHRIPQLTIECRLAPDEPPSPVTTKLLRMKTDLPRLLSEVLDRSGAFVASHLCGLVGQPTRIILGGKTANTPFLDTNEEKRNTIVIPSHSFDYEEYSRIEEVSKGAPEANYILYLEDGMTGHVDLDHHNMPLQVEPRTYLSSLKRLLQEMTVITGLPYRIALHPSGDSSYLREFFADDEMYYNQTAALVRNAEIVLGHATTSFAFAVLWKKPIVVITSEELRGSRMGPLIQSFSKALRAPIISIDKVTQPRMQSTLEIARTESVNTNSTYITKYLKHPDSTEEVIWKIILRVVQEFENTRV